MDHAIGAFFIIAGTVGVPIGLFHQRLERRRIAFAKEIAGTLPAEHSLGRIAPGRAMEGLVAGQEVEEDGRLTEAPLTTLAQPEDVAEQRLGALAVEEMLLVRGALIGITGRQGHGRAEFVVHHIKEIGDFLGLRAVIKRTIDIDAEAHVAGLFDRRDGAIIDAVLANRAIMIFAVAVKMDRPVEIRARLEEMHLLFKQQRIGTDDREFLAGGDAFDDLVDLLVQERLTTGDNDHGRTALVHRVQALLHRQALIEDRIRIIDLATTGAGEIAAQKRLKHEDQRIALAPRQGLLEQIAADAKLLNKRNGHRLPRLLDRHLQCRVLLETCTHELSLNRNNLCHSILVAVTVFGQSPTQSEQCFPQYEPLVV